MPNTLKHALAKEANTLWIDYDGEDAVTLEVLFEVPGGQTGYLRLDQLADEQQYGRLAFDSGKGKAVARAKPGEYILEYDGATAAPKQPYKIAVIAGLVGGKAWEPAKFSDKHGVIRGVKMLEVG